MGIYLYKLDGDKIMNPFLKDRKNPNIKPSKYIRDLFKDKKENDTFEVELYGYTIPQMRANMYDVLKHTNFKYKTRTDNNRLYVFITQA
jgi:predicted TPR repeat methyltransferase